VSRLKAVSSTRLAFLAAIAEYPDDDAPRLVYADWLEEQGDADRAAFIRIQCEIARLLSASEAFLLPGWRGSGGWLDPPKDLRNREHELLEKHGYDWWEELIHGPVEGVRFVVRG
jgi:uncharacterized protein (TIGR02996 family)